LDPAGALLTLLRTLDAGICAQLPGHTLYPGGIPLPLCARNTGIYSGAALTFVILWRSGRIRAMLPPRPCLTALLLAVIAAMGLDGANSVAFDLGFAHLYPPANWLRLATGLGAGVALVLLLSPVIARAAYGGADLRAPITKVSDLLPYGLASVVAFAVIWAAPAWSLYPIAFVSNAGLFGVLIGVNLIAILAGARRDIGNSGSARLGLRLVAAGASCFVELLALGGLKALSFGQPLL